MDRSLADELYSEILEPKVELDQPSVHHIKQSPSVVSDGEDEDWCGDGSSWNGSDGKFESSSDLDREWQRRKKQFHAVSFNADAHKHKPKCTYTHKFKHRLVVCHILGKSLIIQQIGYRDGLIAGKEASAQLGFNIGFKESVHVGYNWGLVKGVTGALECLLSDLREKIIESPETRNKFHHLYESVNHISTTDALKVFAAAISKQNDKAGRLLPVGEQNADCSVLDSCYRQLQSLIVESPALEVKSRVKTADVSSTGEDPLLE